MKSKIDDSLEFSPSEGVVSLVRHKEHIIVLVEFCSNTGCHEMKKVAFQPFDSDDTLFNQCSVACGGVFRKSEAKGYICNQSFKPALGRTLDDYNKRMIFERMRLENESFSWLCGKATIENMLSFIEEEQLNPPMFKAGAELGDQESYNCCTWALERVNMIEEIDATSFVRSGRIGYYMRMPKFSAEAPRLSLPNRVFLYVASCINERPNETIESRAKTVGVHTPMLKARA